MHTPGTPLPVAPLHPDAVLFASGEALPHLPVVEHFAGSEKLILKALALQAEHGAIDLTFDCEDGATACRSV